MDERRQLPRWDIKKVTKVWMPQTQSFSHGTIEDMHLKGMRLSFNKRLFEQQAVHIYFTLGDNFDLIKVEALVPWEKQEQDRYIYGLSFTEMRDENKVKIGEYITANCFDQIKSKWWA